MSRVLLVDDNADQLAVRKLLLEHAAHEVTTAASLAAARTAFAAFRPEVVVVDLRIESDNDGLDLIREFRAADPRVRIIVESGWTEDLAGRVEAAMVDAVVRKPTRSQQLLSTIARLAAMIFFAFPLAAETLPFTLAQSGEAVAEIEMSSPGANWAKAGAEASMVDVRVDDGPAFQVMLFAGETRYAYPVFLGALKGGEHRLSIERNAKFSAQGTAAKVHGAKVRSVVDDIVLSHAPVLYARRNTVGQFTDTPLAVYAQHLMEGADKILQYTVIFSNEDGGTSTRALMSRWGRTTDIEYVYRLNLRTGKAIIQGRDHKDIVYDGPLEGEHPVLMPVTQNNMVATVEGDRPPVRFQVAPFAVDLSAHSREHVIDERPILYRIASEELEREGKLRPFGTVDGEKVSDVRNYVYAEVKVSNRDSALSFNVKLKGESMWRSGSIGRPDYAISRSEWVRTTVELPPGTKGADIEAIGLECLVAQNPEKRFYLAGECTVDAVTKVFLLDRDYRPGVNLWTLPSPTRIPTGITRLYPL